MNPSHPSLPSPTSRETENKPSRWETLAIILVMLGVIATVLGGIARVGGFLHLSWWLIMAPGALAFLYVLAMLLWTLFCDAYNAAFDDAGN